ncbi:MAG: beta-ketoacyl-ACP synthase II [Firmicutes bacterium]|nr:beta-ketoacyl-ACP synthase II [Bacillota bacterium]
MTNRVVITGMGLITPIGSGREGFWNANQNGVSGTGPLTRFDAADFPTRIAAEVKDFEPQRYIERKSLRHMDRFAQMAVCASHMAVEDAELKLEGEDPYRVGVYIGSGIGGIETYDQQHKVLLERGPGRVNPFFIPMLISNMAGSQTAIALGVKGPNMCLVTACATATNSIGEALRILQRGDVDVMLAGGAEASITPLAFAGFCSMKAMSTRNDDPERASRPFDIDRDGFVMGEGSGVLVLETLEHAQKRNANILAELVGYATNNDAFHVVQPGPDGIGAGRAMQEAIRDAGLKPEDIDYINAHGTSTDINDRLETQAVKRVFGDHARKLAISSTKSMTGHLLGASGAVELAAAVLAVKNGWIPPTINYENPDPECDLDYVPNQGRPAEVRAAISNSLGFGGHNATVVIKRWQKQ